ncbi:hypothetical protein L3Q82_015162, partial [Scortum barcoo]
MSHREEASGKTQDTLERLCLSAFWPGNIASEVPPEELEEVSGDTSVPAVLPTRLPANTERPPTKPTLTPSPSVLPSPALLCFAIHHRLSNHPSSHHPSLSTFSPHQLLPEKADEERRPWWPRCTIHPSVGRAENKIHSRR